MNTDTDPTAAHCPTCAHAQAIWDAAAERVASGAPSQLDAATYLDEETLRRSFGTLSASARREQRRPAATVTDELGYDRRGTYYAAADGRWLA